MVDERKQRATTVFSSGRIQGYKDAAVLVELYLRKGMGKLE